MAVNRIPQMQDPLIQGIHRMPGKWPHICLSLGHGLKEATEGHPQPVKSTEAWWEDGCQGRDPQPVKITEAWWEADVGESDSMMTEEGVGLEIGQEIQGQAAGT